MDSCSSEFTKTFLILKDVAAQIGFEEYGFSDNDLKVVDQLIKVSAPR
jgi:hypothetical protein